MIKIKSWLSELPIATLQEMELPYMEIAPSYLAEIARTVAARCHGEGAFQGPTAVIYVQVDTNPPREFTVTVEPSYRFLSKETTA